MVEELNLHAIKGGRAEIFLWIFRSQKSFNQVSSRQWKYRNMKQVIDLLCLTDFLDHPWLMPLFVIGVKEVFYSSSYHFFLYSVSQSGGILCQERQAVQSFRKAMQESSTLWETCEQGMMAETCCAEKRKWVTDLRFSVIFYEKFGENGYWRISKLFI